MGCGAAIESVYRRKSGARMNDFIVWAVRCPVIMLNISAVVFNVYVCVLFERKDGREFHGSSVRAISSDWQR